MLEPAEAAIAPGRTVTADELFRMPEDGYRYALVRGGLLRMTPAGFDHGAVIMNLAVPLGQHVKTGRLGVVCGAETGFVLERRPDTVLAPDIAFVRRERIPAAGRPRTFWDGPPDLAVEVRSPGDTRKEVAEKVAAWLASGTAGGVGRGSVGHVGDDSPAAPAAAPTRRARHAGRRAAAARIPSAGSRRLRVGDRDRPGMPRMPTPDLPRVPIEIHAAASRRRVVPPSGADERREPRLKPRRAA